MTVQQNRNRSDDTAIRAAAESASGDGTANRASAAVRCLRPRAGFWLPLSIGVFIDFRRAVVLRSWALPTLVR